MAERILYYDCFSGISGDMNLGAMIDLGVPEDHLGARLSRLGLSGYSLRFSADSRGGIHGTRADVELTEARPHSHGHDGPAGSHGADRRHRAFSDIRRIIESSALQEGVKEMSLAIFGILAKAEAKIHGVPVEKVEFHEVGALDSIVDIVGAAICLEYLKPDRVLCSTVELGSGWVESAHGKLPVPAPATAEILSGFPVKSEVAGLEMTTPTGAAILAASADSFTDDKRFRIMKTAYGVGHRETAVPNLLRVFLAETAGPGEGGEERILECNIDDMSPELYGNVSELLFAAGAADVWFTPIVMKKTRPAVTMSVLCSAEAEPGLAEIILRETTTFGLRRLAVGKTALERETTTVRTSLGELRVKAAFLGGKRIKMKPEYEDCRRIARERGMALREVYDTVRKEIG
jgi:uncharacterized protein (TIGR00299 family) protein